MRFCLALCLILAGAKVDACDCKAPPPPKKALEFAEAVFLGEAVEVEVEGQTRTVKLKVEKWWKGGDAAEVTLSTHKSGATCGFGFEKGKKYMVYAHKEAKQKLLRVSLCGRTSTQAEAETNGDFKELGEGNKPAADKPREAAMAVKVGLDEDRATVTVAFNYTGKPGDPPTFQGVRMYKYDLLVGKGPTRVGWEGKEGRQTVVMGGKRYTYHPTLTDRTENGTLSVGKADGGRVRVTGVYHYDGVLFVIDETVKPGDSVLLEAVAHGVPAKAVEAVRAAVPKGWTVSASEEAITIRRDKKVGVYNPVGRPPATDDSPPLADVTVTYEIVLWFNPAVGREEYDRLAGVNAAIEARLEKLRDGLRAAKIAHKFDSWLPDTPEQKKLVTEYRAAQMLTPTHRLPDLYTETHCIVVEDSLGHFLIVADPSEAKERAAVTKSVRGLFKAYKPGKE